MIPQARPFLGVEERQVAVRILEQGNLAVGPELDQFERDFGKFLDLPPVVTTSSGFAALHLALLGLGLKPGAEVIVPCISTCAAVRDAIVAAGAVPVFADVEADAPNLDPLSVARRLSPRTGAILCPHHFGIPARLEELVALGVPVLEDCAQALGATYHGRPVGTLGQVGAYSFYPTKILAAVDGGAVASDSPDVLERVRDLRYYGGKNDAHYRYNYKMPNLHAALAQVQLERLPYLLERRRAFGLGYRDILLSQGLSESSLLFAGEGGVVFRFGLKTTRSGAQYLLARLTERGVPCRREFYALCSLDPFPSGQCWIDRFLTLPTYPALSDAQGQFIATNLGQCVRAQDLVEGPLYSPATSS